MTAHETTVWFILSYFVTVGVSQSQLYIKKEKSKEREVNINCEEFAKYLLENWKRKMEC